MNKIVSPIVLAVLLVWTWHTIHAPSAVGFETHSGIQEQWMKLIANEIQTKKPNVQNLEVIKIWTTALDDNKVQVTFAYRFAEPDENGGETIRTISGNAVIHREPSEDPTINSWKMQSVIIPHESLEFSEGSVVTSEGEETSTPSTPPSTESEKSR